MKPSRRTFLKLAGAAGAVALQLAPQNAKAGHGEDPARTPEPDQRPKGKKPLVAMTESGSIIFLEP